MHFYEISQTTDRDLGRSKKEFKKIKKRCFA